MRAYKRTCPEQHEKLSNVLLNQGLSLSKKYKLGDSENTEINMDKTAGSKTEGGKESIHQQTDAISMLLHPSLKQPTLNLSNCHSITINYQHQLLGFIFLVFSTITLGQLFLTLALIFALCYMYIMKLDCYLQHDYSQIV